MSDQNKKLIRRIAGHLNAAGSGGGDDQFHLFGTHDVASLESKLAKHFQMKHAVCVSNATAGLLTLALAAELRSSDFVTSPFTYGGSLSSWMLLGNTPSFADIDPQTLEMRLDEIRSAMTQRTKAILTVDPFGIPCDSEAVRRIADEAGVWYFADCAQSFGATRSGRPANFLADAIVISFTVGKTLFAGEGGAILTNSTELFEKLVWFSQHPYRQKKDLSLSMTNEFGFNARIHPLAAIWANENFDKALADLKEHQSFCFKVIDVLNRSGLTAPITFKADRISPAFFLLTACWKGLPEPESLGEIFQGESLRVRIEPTSSGLIFEKSAFIAGYPDVVRRVVRCPEAEHQAANRFRICRSG